MTAAPRVVVLLASTGFSGHQLYDQRLARALAAHVEVVYVDPPRPFVGRRGRPGPDDSTGGVRVVTAWTVPFGRRRLLAALTAVLRAAAVRWALRRVPGPHAYVVTAAHPWTVRLLGRGQTSYLIKDDYAAGAGLIGVPRDVVVRRRRALLGLVDRVAVVSPALADAVPGMGATTEVSIIPPGCSPGPVSAAPAERASGRPRAVFIGMMSDRIDFDVLEAVIAAGVDVVAVGRQQGTFTDHDRLARLRASGAFEAVGEVGPDEVVEHLHACDFALLPYTDSEFNRASFPLKLLEYLAAGLPVLASPLPAVQWLAAPHVHLVGSAADVPSAVRVLLGEAAEPATAVMCRAFAAQHTWDDRARRHLALLGAR